MRPIDATRCEEPGRPAPIEGPLVLTMCRWPRAAGPLFAAATLAAVGLAGLVGLADTRPVVSAPLGDEIRSYARLPWAIRGPAAPYSSVPTSSVPFTPGPTRTPLPTHTPLPPTGTATATPDPRRAAYPTGADDIVLQIGRTDAEDQGIAWEEMSGTPYLTVYGDGRVIAFRRLFSYDQTLYETRVDDAQIQRWLVPLHYDVRVFDLEARYNHPDESRFAAHMFMAFGTGEKDWKRVSIGGLNQWVEGDLPSDPAAARIRALASHILGLEPFTKILDVPYAATEFTIISHEIAGAGAPTWPLRLNIKKISDAAPLRTGEGYIHGPPGHLVANAATAQPVRDLTVKDARERFPAHAFVATYKSSGSANLFAVGARPEVPGGSRWVPERTYDKWYRKDEVAP